MRLKKFLAGFTDSKGFISQRGSDDLQGINRLASENKPLRALKPRFDSFGLCVKYVAGGRAVQKSGALCTKTVRPVIFLYFQN